MNNNQVYYLIKSFLCLILFIINAGVNYNPNIVEILQNLQSKKRIILYSANHNSEKINNVHLALTTGMVSQFIKVNFFYESAYLNVDLTNALISTDTSKNLLRKHLGIQFSFMDSIQLNKLIYLIKFHKLNFIGIDCSGSRKQAIDILIDSTYKYLKEHKMSVQSLLSIEDLVRDMPNIQTYMDSSLLPVYDIYELEKFYKMINDKVDSDFLFRSWSSIYHFFNWQKIRLNYLSKSFGDCRGISELHAYRDRIMFENYINYRTDSGIDVIWLGCSHSPRRLFDGNSRGDRFIGYPKSFGDFFSQANFTNYASVMITEENLELNKIESFDDSIGGVAVKVYFPRSNKQREEFYFNMKVFCGLSSRTNWFKSFDYIVVAK